MREDKPSTTAALVFKVITFMGESELGKKIISPCQRELNSLIYRGLYPKTGSHRLSLLSHAKVRKTLSFIEDRLLPGFSNHILARKVFIASEVRRRLQTGRFRQVLVIGAGLDSLGTCLAEEFSQVQVFEIDHPASQKAKREAFANSRISSRVSFISVDLAKEPLHSVLKNEPRFHLSLPTLVVTEAVLMYVPPESVNAYFASLREFKGDLDVIFTFMIQNARKKIEFVKGGSVISAWLKSRGEPLLWGIEPDKLAEFLNQRGFILERIVGAEDFRRDFFNGSANFPIGESVALAHRTQSN